jgi:sulfate adenylyltransferase subunit 1 (EFTu-like GTPase family)
VDVNTQATAPAETLRLNEIGRVELECEERVVVDAYRDCKGTGKPLPNQPRFTAESIPHVG